VNATIDGFAARDGIIYDHYDGVLAAPAAWTRSRSKSFWKRHRAPVDLQVEALVVALRTILAEYRSLVSFAANI